MENDIIFHIDVNSAFLSWTAADRLQKGDKVDLRQIPSIIGGDMTKRHGVVLAKSIPAKAYGIATGEPVANAMRKCPSLVCAAPDHKMYSEKSHALMEYLMQICPEIEQVSIDECFMNYTPIRKNYASPESAAHIIKDTIREKFGFTVNIGIWYILCIPGKSGKKCGLYRFPPCLCAAAPAPLHYITWESVPSETWPVPRWIFWKRT